MQRETPDLKHVKSLTRLMDSKFRLPGTKWRFGLDPILGLLPGVGDFLSYGISGLIIFYVARFGASKKLIAMMLGNAALDAIIGSIPILGHIFDFAYKANERNLRLLQEHYEEGKHQGGARKYILFFLLAFLVVLILIIVAIYFLISWIIGLF